MGTGAHGSTIKYHASISSQVARMTILNGSGQLEEITDPKDLVNHNSTSLDCKLDEAARQNFISTCKRMF